MVIGVHAPEFAFEKRPRQRASAPWPNSASPIRWRSTTTTPSGAPSTTNTGPRITSSTRRARIRHHHFGEGEYDESERVDPATARRGGAIASCPRRLVDGASVPACEAPPDIGRCAVAGNLYRLRPRRELRLARRAVVQDAATFIAAPERRASISGASTGDWTVGAEQAALNAAGGAHRLPLPCPRPASGARARRGRQAGAIPRHASTARAPGDDHGGDIDADGTGTVTRAAALPA